MCQTFFESIFIFEAIEASDSKEREAASKVDLINPENGEISHVDIEEFARTVQVRDDNQETIELIDAVTHNNKFQNVKLRTTI